MTTPNSETDTPRTDAEIARLNPVGQWGDTSVIGTDFARQLERELNAEKEAHAISFAGWKKALLERDTQQEAKLRVIGQCADMLQERDALKAELQTARDGIMTQAREIERAWKECEELRKDKARLDWLTRNHYGVGVDSARIPLPALVSKSESPYVRQAIDAAIKGHQ